MNLVKFLFSFIFSYFSVNHLCSQSWKQYADSAKVYSDQKNSSQAIEYYVKSKAYIPADSFYTDTHIRISKALAALYYSTRQNDRAILICSELQQIIQKLYTEINGDYAWSCNMLGVIYNNYGKLDSAKYYYVRAKAIREKLAGTNDPAYAQSCNNLGALYRDLGQYDMAEPLLLEAKVIREKLTPKKQDDPYAITCVSLANLYRDMGQYEKAEMFYLEAKDRRALPGKENWDYASSCNILADLYAYKQEFNKAETLYLEAKEIRSKLDNTSYDYAQTCNNLSSLYRDMGQYKKAEALALEAKSIYDSLPKEHPAHAINNNNIGELYAAMNEYPKAVTYFLRARKLWADQLGKSHPYYAQNATNLGRAYWNLNKPADASGFYIESFNCQYNLVSKVFQFTNEKEKQLYLKNATGSADEYQSFYYKKFSHNKEDVAYTISISNRSLILSSVQQARQIIYNSKDTFLNKEYNRWISLKDQLGTLYSRPATEKTQIIETEEKADMIEKELSLRSSAFKKAQKTLTWRSIQLSLAKNEAAIEFVSFRLYDGTRWTDSTYYVALILRRDQPQPRMVTLFEKKSLDTLLSLLKNDESINNLYSAVSESSNKNLYNLIWKPIEKYLGGINKIYFAPAGNLFKISFAALNTGNSKVLSDRFKLVQLNTTASITNQQAFYIKPADKIQLYGGIKYDADSASLQKEIDSLYTNKLTVSSAANLSRGAGFQYLPGTKEEVTQIKMQADKSKISAAVLSGISATKESFEGMTGAASPAVLHIATHGFFFPDPANDTRDSIQKKFETTGKIFKQSDNPLLRSGLLFAGANNAWKGKYYNGIDDGILTAYEVSNMYFPNTKLVVLSACETALGDVQGSEGVYGLQRGFRMAGVENLVMSLWKVPDAETSEFMQMFYKNLLNKQSINDSFYDAQTSMKNKYRNAPYKWAAWVLIK